MDNNYNQNNGFENGYGQNVEQSGFIDGYGQNVEQSGFIDGYGQNVGQSGFVDGYGQNVGQNGFVDGYGQNEGQNNFAQYEEQNENHSNSTIVNTHEGATDGQNKCPRCGATDISINMNTGELRCNFCRHEFKSQDVDIHNSDVDNLEGMVIASGAQDMQADVKDIVTLKCSSCGAEVVIDTNEAMQSRCHWCRNTLSINQQVPNGSVPDIVLPFNLRKEEARNLIDNFVGKRRFFAHPTFKREFSTENIMGVYFPYMVVDVNGHACFAGQGEHETRRYTVKRGKSTETRYDADLYNVEREFDIGIDDLTIEASSDKLDKVSKNKTNNIINSIMPFDVENAVKWNAGYMKGFSSEKRDVNIKELQPVLDVQAKDIARHAANNYLEFYDRGVKWSSQFLEIKGEKWLAAHLPVWLYSYYEKSGNDGKLHYVAVNARTKETMGSVPIHKPKLVGVSLLIEILSGGAMVKLDFDFDFLLLSLGVLFYIWMYNRYRNTGARHAHEKETKKQVSNLRKVDMFVSKRRGLKNSKMSGANNEIVYGNKFK